MATSPQVASVFILVVIQCTTLGLEPKLLLQVQFAMFGGNVWRMPKQADPILP